MNDKLDLILVELLEIKSELKNLKSDIAIIKNQTSKMDSHVDFVNSVYEKVETPMNYIVDKFNSVLLTSDKPKEQIE